MDATGAQPSPERRAARSPRPRGAIRPDDPPGPSARGESTP
ncbi:hypothetical protein CZ771_09945 [Actinomycetales bacterium JB111]|nr:hypothetical protein CZ771_09945 [Actinomycetales bacterium JB111]